jgi:hypothetical protein
MPVVLELMVAAGLLSGALIACSTDSVRGSATGERAGSSRTAQDSDEAADSAVGGSVGELNDGDAVGNGGASGGAAERLAAAGNGGTGPSEATAMDVCQAVCPVDQFYIDLNAMCDGSGEIPDRNACLVGCLTELEEAAFPPICGNEFVLWYECENNVQNYHCGEPGGAVAGFFCIPHRSAAESCLYANQ